MKNVIFEDKRLRATLVATEKVFFALLVNKTNDYITMTFDKDNDIFIEANGKLRLWSTIEEDKNLFIAVLKYYLFK